MIVLIEVPFQGFLRVVRREIQISIPRGCVAGNAFLQDADVRQSVAAHIGKNKQGILRLEAPAAADAVLRNAEAAEPARQSSGHGVVNEKHIFAGSGGGSFRLDVVERKVQAGGAVADSEGVDVPVIVECRYVVFLIVLFLAGGDQSLSFDGNLCRPFC